MSEHIDLPAPDFTLRDLDRGQHALADYRARSLLLVFHRHLG